MSVSRNNFILKDVVIVLISVAIAVFLVKLDVIPRILSGLKDFKIFGSFFAGMFFTSIFTTAPAIVTLGEISRETTVLGTALSGAFGALLGDLVIFSFIRDKLSLHLAEAIKHDEYWKRLMAILRLRYFRWLTFLLGGIIITSPLPDELAISIFGFSKMKTRTFIPISLVFNFIGICVIGFVAKAI